MKNKISFILLSLLFVACTSSQKKEELVGSSGQGEHKTFQWESKALIKNTKTGEANILNLDIIGQKPFPIRAEVTTSLGIHLASILILENEVQFLLPKSKKFYSGPNSGKSLKPILNVNLDPRLIIASLFDEGFPDWKCQIQEGKFTDCETAIGDKITWFAANAEVSKRVEVKGENYESQFQIKSQKEFTQVKESTFTLRVPDNYKKIILQN